MKKWAIIGSTVLIIGLVIFGFIFIQNELSSSNQMVASNHSELGSNLVMMSENIETDILFVKERIEQELKEEQEKLRIEEEKRKEEERLRLEEEKRKEEERLRLEEEKRQEEQRRLEEEKQKQETEKPTNDTTTEKPPTSPYSGISAYERDVVKYTNQARAEHGLPELKIDNKLSEVAWYKSKDMQSVGYFDHTSPTYGSPFDMMLEFGVNYTAAGENIAYGFTSAKSVVDGWMNSPGHRANILNESFTHIGVGYVQDGHYATQMFIRK